MEEVRVEEIRELISRLLEKKSYKELKNELIEMYPADIAEVFEELSKGEYILLFRLLNKDQAAEVFSYLSPQHRRDIVSGLQEQQLKYILDELYFDDKIDFLEEMPANFAMSLIAASPTEERKLINQFLSYPDNSAGSLMTIEYVDLKRHMSVGQAMERIRRVGLDKETIYTCYVLDDTRRLIGLVSLRRLVLSHESELIEDIMSTDAVLARTLTDQEEVADLFKKYDLMAVPVVDGEHRMVGIITIDDIVDVIEQENTEDFQRMAAIQPSDDAYLDSGVFKLAWRRIPWLLVLMISATFTGAIITHYEELLSTAVILASFIPMLMNSGGNAGSQTSTLVIRGIALGEVSFRDLPSIILKELRVGALAGLALAVINLMRMFLMGSHVSIAITVSATLFLTIVMAKLIGCTLPMLAKRVRLDPAIMASPLITTIVDALSLIVFFGLASVLVL